ncbi:type II toxin-antitoxin system RelE/ParE family toxin [Pelagicoccus sp. SDUM812005]|uniref:type II toxin-antitoxin system RelE/ParE family toxin n=1 Tax=Pelagicoccus sp. SDUM812005 TaxID=3041257 RepID=UPI0031BBBF37
MNLVFHKLVQRDLRVILRYYEEEGGPLLADRFFLELGSLVNEVESTPEKFHEVRNGLKRANMLSFPYHLLFSTQGQEVRILVLRHHRRRPDYGMSRK